MKKLLFLMCALLLGVSGAWAQITVSPSTGVYWKNGAVSSDAWAPQWKSNAKAIDGTTPLLVFTGETGMNTATGDIYSDQSYTLEVPSGYVIVGYTFNGTATGGDVTITPTGESATTISSGNSLGAPLDITVAAQSTSFALSGSGHITDLQLIVTVSPIYVNIARTADGLPSAAGFGSFSGQTFTTSVGAGLAGLTITADAGCTIGEQSVNVANYGNCFKLVTSAAATNYKITLTAPEGYKIAGYYLDCSANTKDAVHTLTSEDGSVSVVASAPPYNNPTGPKVFEVTGLNTNSTYFTINTANKANTLYLPNFRITVVKGAVVNVTYKVMFNGSEVATATVDGSVVGAAPLLPTSVQKPLCGYSYYSDEECTTPLSNLTAGSTTVYAKCTLPFTVSTEFNTAKWYYLKLKDGNYPTYVTNGTPNVTSPGSNAFDRTTQWAFFGDPYNGLQIKNRAAGDGLVLGSASPASDGNTGGNTYATLQTAGSQTYECWFPGVSTYYNSTGFYLNNAQNYALNQRSTANLAYWTGGKDAGSTFRVEEVPDIAVDVTYELNVGGQVVNTVIDKGVAANSDVNVPATLTTGYSILAYDFATSGTIGEEDCTIIVTATLKSGVVTDINQLSNGKAYTLTTERGSLGTNGTQMVSSFGTSYSASNFAIINYENNYYLYSIVDSKWVGNPTTVNGIANQPALTEDLNSVTAISFDTTNTTIASPLFFMAYGSNGVNVSNYSTGIVVNSWTTRDPGNQYCIFEVDDFDATEALAALEEHFHPAAEALFNDAIATLEAINFGTGLNQYSFTGSYAGYTSQAATIIEGLKSQGYSEDNLAAAQALLANYALNMPATGKFYRIQGYSGNYITSNTAGSNASMNGTASVNNIVYYSAEKNLVFFGGGFGLYNTSIVAPAGSSLNAYDFMEGAQKGHYYVKSNASGMGTYCYDNTANGTKVDRNGSPVTSGSYQTDWTLEEITTLPVTISSAGYATLYAPVALTIPEGVTAYVAIDKGEYLHLDAIEDGIIPAETGVVLAGEKGTYNFAITTDGIVESALTGTLAAINRPANSYILATGSHDVAFYKDGATTIPGFKAYLIADGGGTVKTFIFGGETEVKAIEAALNAGKVVYDLSGRHVKNPAKGVYIVNGKKVLF